MSATMTETAKTTQQQTAPPATGQQTTMAELKQAPVPLEEQLPDVIAGFGSTRAFSLLRRSGAALADSTIVPKMYQGNLPNCIIALEIAQRIGASVLLIMQNLYMVHGKPGWSAKFLIACFNACGRYTSIKYKRVGEQGKDSYGYVAYTTELSTGDLIEGPVIDWKLVKAEKWDQKDGSKWLTMPEKMFRFRAAAWMIDVTAPEISMGIRTADEEEDAFDARPNDKGQFEVTAESLKRVEKQVETAAAAAAPAGNKSAAAGDPPPDSKTWAATLRGFTDLKKLNKCWQDCLSAFGGNAPDECDEAYQNTREQIQERAAKQSETSGQLDI